MKRGILAKTWNRIGQQQQIEHTVKGKINKHMEQNMRTVRNRYM
jgi:hypothetical protein